MARPHHTGNQAGNVETDLNAIRRETLAFRLRVEGYDFDQIAAKCGYSNRGAAHKAYQRAIRRIPDRNIEEMRETIFAQQMHALASMSHKIANGDTFAVREMTAIHDRMAKLFGLDMQPGDAFQGQYTKRIIIEESVPVVSSMSSPLPVVEGEHA